MSFKQAVPKKDFSGSIAIVLPPRERFSPDEAGAIALSVRHLAAASRHSLVVLGMPGRAAPFSGIAFHPVRPGWGCGLHARYARGVERALRDLNPCAIEAHNRPDLARRFARRFPRLPVSLFVHNDPQTMRGAETPAVRLALLRRLARVAAVSDWLRRRFLDGVTPPAAAAPVAVLPNALDLAALPVPIPAAARERLILFAGRMAADKGADLFVRACADALPRLPGWRAEMIGADRFGATSPDTPFLRRLRPEAAAAGIALRGYLPHAAVLAAMSRAAIVVAPSRWAEPFGLVALEAMACGTALVCARRGGLPEVVGDAALLFDPDEEGGLASALLALAGNATDRAGLGAAGRARAEAFAAPRIAARLGEMRDAAVRSDA